MDGNISSGPRPNPVGPSGITPEQPSVARDPAGAGGAGGTVGAETAQTQNVDGDTTMSAAEMDSYAEMGNPLPKDAIPTSINNPRLAYSNASPQSGQQGLDQLFDPATLLALVQNSDVAPPVFNPKTAEGKAKEDADIYSEGVKAEAEAAGMSPEQWLETQNTQDNSFNGQAANSPNKGPLMTAYYSGDTSNLTPEQLNEFQELFSKAVQDAAQFAKESYPDVSQSWTGGSPKNGEMLKEVNLQGNAFFQEALAAGIQNGTISQEDATVMNNLFNGVSSDPAPTADQQAMFKNLTTTTVEKLQAQFGFDAGFKLSPDVTFYNNVINGDFAQALMKLVYKSLKITPAQQRLLAKYQENPNDPSIPKEIKDLAMQVADKRNQFVQYYQNKSDPGVTLSDSEKAEANELTAEIGAKYGMGVSWNPEASTLAAVNSVSAAGTVYATQAQAGIDNLKGIIDKGLALAEAMPEGPEKETYLNYLKNLGAIINELQQVLYSIQASASDLARRNSAAQIQLSLEKMEAYMKTHKIVSNKAKKKKKNPFKKMMKGITQACMVIAAAIVCVAFPPAGAVMMAATIAYIIASNVDPGSMDRFASKAMQYTAEAVSAICKEVVGPIAEMCGASDELKGKIVNGIEKFQTFAASAIVALVIAGGNPMIAQDYLLTDSQALQNIVLACGGSERDVQITMMAASVIIEVAIAIFIGMCTAGIGTSGLAATMGAKISAMSAKVASMTGRAIALSEKAATTLVYAIGYAGQITMLAMSITGSAVTLNNELIMAQIAKIKAKGEAFAEMIEACVQILKQLIDKLLASLSGTSDFISLTQSAQVAKYEKAQAVLTELTG